MWRKLPDFWAEKEAQNPVTSLAVVGLFGREFGHLQPQALLFSGVSQAQSKRRLLSVRQVPGCARSMRIHAK